MRTHLLRTSCLCVLLAAARPLLAGPLEGKKGPGLKGADTAFLKLPVPPAADLEHVRPEHFAAALGNDPEKIFAFVRDHIAFEGYSGCLRGPNGTLLAMAGNSVDRAALLAALLEKAGQRVRFVEGVLPEALARDLVLSMGMRPIAKMPEAGAGEAPKEVAAFSDSLLRDYGALRAEIEKRGKIPRASAPGVDDLVKEARTHFWVQWQRDGKWLDLDPSFADAKPGHAFAEEKANHAALPDKLFHLVEVRIRLEEQGIFLKNDETTKPTSRILLTHQARAADLTEDWVLTHQPENWKGPRTDLKTALSAAASATGRIRPVLLVGEKWHKGEPFRETPPSGKGLGGIGGLLGGEGVRTPAPVAVAEFLDLVFIYPDGRKETIVRPLYDRVGAANRMEGKALTAKEVRDDTLVPGALLPGQETFAILFTTGAIRHLPAAPDEKEKEKKSPGDVRPGLRSALVAFHAGADGLLDRFSAGFAAAGVRGRLVSYPDSPRVAILSIRANSKQTRVALDLRRMEKRWIPLGDVAAESVFLARMVAGVVEGHLERTVMDVLAPSDDGKKSPWRPGKSTSAVFEQAAVGKVPLTLLTKAPDSFPEGISGEAKARLAADLKDHWVVAPAKAVTLGEKKAFAWWRIDPKTGATIAMTEEGLHGAPAAEYHITHVYVGGGAGRDHHHGHDWRHEPDLHGGRGGDGHNDAVFPNHPDATDHRNRGEVSLNDRFSPLAAVVRPSLSAMPGSKA